MAETLYSPGRIKQLRILLWATVVLGGLLAAAAVLVLVDGDPPGLAVIILTPAVLLLGGAFSTMRSLELPGTRARVGCVLTGLLLVVVGLFLARATIGIVPSVVGILMILLALLPDVGER